MGDRIVEIDGKKVREGMKLQNMFRQAGRSGTNQIKSRERGRTVTLNIERPAEYVPDPLDESLCGIRISDIQGYAKLKFKLRQKDGVVVVKVFKGGIGERYGLRGRRRDRQDQQRRHRRQERLSGPDGRRLEKELRSLSGEEERNRVPSSP